MDKHAQKTERRSELTQACALACLPAGLPACLPPACLPRSAANSPRPPRCLSREWPVYMLTLCLRVSLPLPSRPSSPTPLSQPGTDDPQFPLPCALSFSFFVSTADAFVSFSFSLVFSLSFSFSFCSLALCPSRRQYSRCRIKLGLHSPCMLRNYRFIRKTDV